MPERHGIQRFEEFYRQVFGERWLGLSASLREPSRQFRRRNAFLSTAPPADASHLGSWGEWLDPIHPQGIFRKGEEGLLDAYIMDPASIVAAIALAVRPGERVLDLCAAPGGKTLILAEALAGRRGGPPHSGGRLVANELSSDRRDRLTKVIRQYVPATWRESHVFVTGKDGTRYGLHEPGAFDAVLLDAPCSGERHLLEHPEELATWSPRRAENLVIRQYSLLSSALLCVRPGGRVVYSTCAISPSENDGVIERLLKKNKSGARVIREWPAGVPAEIAAHAERTDHGWRFLPDRCGFGPFYFTYLEKDSAPGDTAEG